MSLPATILATKPFVFVGLLSYPLYLWHWPILAFSRYWLGTQLATPVILTILAATFLMAYLSWRFVETQLRRGLLFRNKKPIILGICLTTPVLVTLSLAIIVNHGFPLRVPKEVMRYDAGSLSKAFRHKITTERVRRDNLPVFGDEQGKLSCLVWGDSHAGALIPGIDAACKNRGVRGYQATNPVTPPLFDFIYVSGKGHGLKEKTPAFNQAILEYMRKHKIDVAILGGFWLRYATKPSFENQLIKTIDELTNSGIFVVIVLDVATHQKFHPHTLAMHTWRSRTPLDTSISLESHRSRNKLCDEIIMRVAKGNVVVADPSPFFINSSGRWQYANSGETLYRDSGHLSVKGGLRLTPLFEDVFDLIKKRKSTSRVAQVTRQPE